MAQRSVIPALLLWSFGLGGGMAAPLAIYTEHAPPASMLIAGSATVTGRETDKIRELMARTRTEYKITLQPWKRAYTAALNRDGACVYSTSRTPEREHLFKWVGPTDQAEWVFWGLPDHPFPLKTLDDARKLRIGTYNGDAREEFLRGRGFQTDPVDNDLVNPQKLLLGRIDLWAVATRNGTAAPGRHAWSDRIVPLLVFHRVQVYLACNRAVPDELIVRLNAALQEMRRDGTVARLERRYEDAARP